MLIMMAHNTIPAEIPPVAGTVRAMAYEAATLSRKERPAISRDPGSPLPAKDGSAPA